MKWMIVSDSSCNLTHIWDLPANIGYSTVPMKIRAGATEFFDTAEIDTGAMLNYLDNYKGPSSSACPSPQEWAEQFEKADQVLAITISSNLSGSYQSAMSARSMVLEEHPEKKIHVVDTLSCGAELVYVASAAVKAIERGESFEQVVERAEAVKDHAHLLFVLCSFENLVKNGRMSRLSGFVAGKLGLRAVGRASEDGKIDMFGKARGEISAVGMVVEEMRQSGYNGGSVLIDHVHNEKMAVLLTLTIKKNWPKAKVHTGTCGGLCSFYAQRSGIILGYLTNEE